jgi:hypothetical protein
MPTRKDPPASVDTVLAFELRILVPELFITGKQCLYAPQIKGVDSPRLPLSSGSCCFGLRSCGFKSLELPSG